jgi:hypothetical protein
MPTKPPSLVERSLTRIQRPVASRHSWSGVIRPLPRTVASAVPVGVL